MKEELKYVISYLPILLKVMKPYSLEPDENMAQYQSLKIHS